MRRACFSCGILILSFLRHSCLARGPSGLTPYDVEAAYLYDFGKFTQWPAGARANSQSFSICILGQDPFGEKLDSTIVGETMQGRKIVARRLASVAAADNCQIVFIAASEDARLDRILAALQKKPVLTVGDPPDFLARGGMIQFLLADNRVRFAVNLSAARQAGLALSSDLLKVAVYVKTKRAPESKR